MSNLLKLACAATAGLLASVVVAAGNGAHSVCGTQERGLSRRLPEESRGDARQFSSWLYYYLLHEHKQQNRRNTKIGQSYGETVVFVGRGVVGAPMTTVFTR